MAKKLDQDYFRSMIFGVEDALVSTTGVVVGISTGSHERAFVILSGFVMIAVQALSMSAGQYLSEEAVHQMSKKGEHKESVLLTACIMFTSYTLAGLIPIFPYMLLPFSVANWVSVLFAFAGLFALGYLKGKYLRIQPGKSAIKMVIIGGAATILGLIIGNWLKVL
jgi:VIT1/CCC1 family predicted Fe2+/Mn2+ transporter